HCIDATWSFKTFFLRGIWKQPLCFISHELWELINTLNSCNIDDKEVLFTPCMWTLSPSNSSELDTKFAMIRDVGATWVILGHCDKGHVFDKSNEIIDGKVAYTLLYTQHEAKVLYQQVEKKKHFAVMKDWSKVIQAYEPVWSIKTAAPQQTLKVIVANVSDMISKLPDSSGDGFTGDTYKKMPPQLGHCQILPSGKFQPRSKVLNMFLALISPFLSF
uniref:Triosephosphate isomerase n=1 Tax=Leptobrachium leishanense TaxID=445787 RepID=A0A8C5MVH2_9ANUR